MKLYLGRYVWTEKNGPPRWELPVGMHSSVDLRPLAEQAMRGGQGGLAIFAGDTTDSDFDFLGRPDEPIDKRAKAAIAKQFRIAADGATLADALTALLMAGDPKGEASHRPILPTRGFFELHCGAKLKSNPFAWGDEGTSAVRDILQEDFRREFERDPDHAKKTLGFLEQQYRFKNDEWKEFVPQDLRRDVDGPRKPETTISDDFTRANGSTIGNQLSWTEVRNDFTTVSNEVELTTTPVDTWSSARANSALSSADHYAQCKATSMTNTFTGIGPICRFAAGAETYYSVYAYNNDNTLKIGKSVSGGLSNLNSAAITISLPNVLRLTVNGSSLEGFQDGVSKVTITDSAITGNTQCGFMIYRSNSVGGTGRLDDFEASDLAASGTLYTQLERNMRGVMRGAWTGGF